MNHDDHRPSWKRRLLTAFGVVGTIASIVSLLLSIGPSPSPAPRPSPTNPSPRQTTGGSSAVYLSALRRSGGTQPLEGDVNVAGRSYAHSVYYEAVPIAVEFGPCASAGWCRNVQYEVGGQYSHFATSFAITGDGGEEPKGRWWVVLDNKVLQQGQFQGNEAPIPISLSIAGGQVLELRAEPTEMGTESANLIWTEARVAP